jgi:arsenate reductase
MAEGFLHLYGGDKFNVYSAGTDPAERVSPLALEVMAEKGIDISEHRPKHVREFLGKLSVRHLIIVCEGANESCPTIFPGMMNRHLWPFDDPATFKGSPEATREKFRTVRDQIESRIKLWLKENP